MGRAIGVTFEVGAKTMGTVASTFATVEARLKGLKGSMKGLKEQQKRASELSKAHSQLTDLRAKVNPSEEITTKLAAAETAYARAQRQAKKYGIDMKNVAMVQAQTTVAIDRTTAALAWQEKRQANQAKRKELHGQILGTVATVATVAAPVKLAIDYESAMADVKKVTNFDAPGFAAFSRDMLKLSTEIPMAADGLAQIAAEAGQGGIPEEELLRFTKDAAIMAVAFDIAAAEAGGAMKGLRANFHLSQDGVIQLGDAFNQLANNMDATAGQIINYTNRVGTAATFGFSGQQIGSLGAAMVALKIPAEVGARATNSLFMKLNNAEKASKDGKAAFKRLGFSTKQMSKMFKEDAQGTLVKFLDAVKGSKDPMRDLTAILGEGFSDEIAKLVNGLDQYKKALGLIADESEYAGSMQKEYTTRAGTTKNSLELMSNAGRRLAIVMGNTMLPAVMAVSDTTVKLLEPVAQLATQYPQVTTAVFGVVGALAGLKVASFACAYAATIVSDGWLIFRGAMAALHPRILINKAAMVAYKIETVALGAAAKAVALAKGILNAALMLTKPRLLATTVAMKVCRAASLALAAGSKILAAGIRLVSLAMSANPVGALIRLLMLLGGGMVYLYNNCEPVRTALDALWTGVKNGAGKLFAFLGEKFEWVTKKIEWLGKAWAKVKGWFGSDDDGSEAVDFNFETAEKRIAVETAKNEPEQSGHDPRQPVAALTTATDSFSGLGPASFRQVQAFPTLADAAGQSLPNKLNIDYANVDNMGNLSKLESLMADMPQSPMDMSNFSGLTPAASTKVEAPVTQQFSFTMNGMPDKEFAQRVVDSIKSNSRDLEGIISKIVGNAIANSKRLSYGG